VRSGWLERGAVLICSVALAVGLIALLSGYFTRHDAPAVTGAAAVGLHFADQGDELLAPGSRHPRYDSSPPTSGPHVPVTLRSDRRRLSDDEILQALSNGDIVIVYGTARPGARLLGLIDALAGPFTPALAASGQALLLDHQPGTDGLLALAWTRMLRVRGPADPLLRQFVETYLGHRPSARRSALPGR
jgi:hypothetical protein